MEKKLIIILLVSLFMLFLSGTVFSEFKSTPEHFFSPDFKEWLIIIGFLVSVIIAPLIGWLVKKLINDKEKRDQKRHEDILFMFDNHGHEGECDNKDCRGLKTTSIRILIPTHVRDSNA